MISSFKKNKDNFAQVLVIGGGPGGYVAAIRAAQLGKKVTLVDKSPRLGGVCIKHGCIPSKALIHVATLVHEIQEMEDLGVKVKGMETDLAKIQEWKQNQVVNRLTKGLSFLCDKNGVKVITGKARFEKPHQVNIETEEKKQSLEYEDAIIASGSKPIEIPKFKFDRLSVLSSRDALALKKVPQRLAVIGGGYIGLELGTVYAKLGSQVTVIELMDQLLPGTPNDLVRVVERNLKKLSVKVHLNAEANGFEAGKGKIVVRATTEGEDISVEADKVLVTVGRKPITKGLGIEKAGVEVDKKGFIKVDKRMRTMADHIYAIGDVAGQPMLAHKASKEGRVAAENIAGLHSEIDNHPVPVAIFTDPEIATVGMTEEEAGQRGYKPLVGKFPFTASGRALTTGKTDGFIKVIADGETNRLLGTHIVGPQASDLISEAALAIKMEATLADVAKTVHPHPTYSESLMEACEAALKQAIHILN